MKLCDFGCSITNHQMRKTFCGTFEYMAPEMIGNRSYDKTVDIWSLGIILFEMIHGRTPFKGVNLMHIADNIRRGAIPFKGGLSSEIKDLICTMLKDHPRARSSISQIKGHVLMRKFYEKPIIQEKKESKERVQETKRPSTPIEQVQVDRFAVKKEEEPKSKNLRKAITKENPPKSRRQDIPSEKVLVERRVVPQEAGVVPRRAVTPANVYIPLKENRVPSYPQPQCENNRNLENQVQRPVQKVPYGDYVKGRYFNVQVKMNPEKEQQGLQRTRSANMIAKRRVVSISSDRGIDGFLPSKKAITPRQVYQRKERVKSNCVVVGEEACFNGF